MHNIIPNAELIFIIDMLAAVAFAVSGALVASRKGLDILGFMWLAVITGVGGVRFVIWFWMFRFSGLWIRLT